MAFYGSVSTYAGTTVHRISWEWIGEPGDADKLECYENLARRIEEVRQLTAASAPSATIEAVRAEQQRLERLSAIL